MRHAKTIEEGNLSFKLSKFDAPRCFLVKSHPVTFFLSKFLLLKQMVKVVHSMGVGG